MAPRGKRSKSNKKSKSTPAKAEPDNLNCTTCPRLLSDDVFPFTDALPTIPDEILYSNTISSSLESDKKRATERLDWISSAKAPYHEYVSRLRDAQALIRKKLHNVKMATAATRRVPAEVLLLIWDHCTEDVELRRTDVISVLSQVSRHWRALAVGTPKYWSRLYIPLDYISQQKLLLLHLVLQRSANYPLSLTLVEATAPTRRASINPALAALIQCAPRWSDLHIDGSWGYVQPLLDISDSPFANFSVLRKLSIILRTPPPFGRNLPSSFHSLFKSATALTDLTYVQDYRESGVEVEAVGVPDEWPLGNVKRMKLKLGGLACLSALTRAGNVEHVEMCLTGLIAHPVHPGIIHPVVASKLETLYLTSTAYDHTCYADASLVVKQFFEYVNLPALVELSLYCYNPFGQPPPSHPFKNHVFREPGTGDFTALPLIRTASIPALQTFHLDFGPNTPTSANIDQLLTIIRACDVSVETFSLVFPYIHMHHLIRIFEALEDNNNLPGLENIRFVYSTDRALQEAGPFGGPRRLWSDDAHRTVFDFVKARCGPTRDLDFKLTSRNELRPFGVPTSKYRTLFNVQLPESVFNVAQSKIRRGKGDALSNAVDAWKKAKDSESRVKQK